MKTKSVTRTRVYTVICPNCKAEIYSRARHDFHYCTCGDTAVDGGFDYLRCLYKVKPSNGIRYVHATRQELYDDWNTQTDKFGFIQRSK